MGGAPPESTVSRVPSALFLDPGPEAARAARAHVQHALDGLELQHLSEAAELGTSELVTNAVLHARTSIRLTVVRTPTGVRIEVGDDSTVEPRSLIGRDRAVNAEIDAWALAAAAVAEFVNGEPAR